MAPTYYEAYAGIWVSRPTYLSYSDESNRYITPVQEQSVRLGEQLRTSAFLREIAQRAPLLARFATFQGGDEILRRIIGTGLTTFPSGNNLLVLRFRSDNPELSFQALNAVIEAYNDKAVGDRIGQGGLASSFYESRVKAAEEQLAKANEDLRRYVAANPRLTTIDPARGASATTASRLGLPAMAIDPELAELLRRTESNPPAPARP
jgi:hypothetical protein